jgi:hypothetical protein
MTPEKRARRLIAGVNLTVWPNDERAELIERIATAISEAVETEREAWITHAASTAVTPKRCRELGMSPDTPEQRSYEMHHSNALYFLLSSMGLTHEEIVKRFEAQT